MLSPRKIPNLLIGSEEEYRLYIELRRLANDNSINENDSDNGFYEAELDLDALRKGAHYIDLRQSYIIFICMFDPFGEGLPKYTFEETCCENPALQLNDRATKVFVNVHGDKSKMSKELAAVAAYFSDGVVADEYTAEIDNRVNVNRQDSRLERDNMRMEEFLWEERYWAGKKAREEGLAEGRDERSQEIAWNLYEAKLPLDMIAKTTKLTMEQVKAVIKKHNVLI